MDTCLQENVPFPTTWAAANGGLRGVWPSFLEIGLFWPFSAPAKSRKRKKKGPFPQISSDLLKPPSLGEGASGLFGGWPGSPENVSCSRATPDLHQCNLGVALEQETFSGLPGLPPKRLLAPSPIEKRAIRKFGGLCQAISDLELSLVRGRKRHINIWHINNFSVTRVPRSSLPGTRTKMFIFLGFRTQHINS